ncbi:MAG: hypothetical protein CME70_19590 [Halobacteriovorax sp.]|nr:hypothetical protein [Halobacteriovorax sp.]|tara:strand:+ start:5643 stop:6614 length:972 start_codon:yes stop_codon:yes gene_type:complete
MRKHLAIFALWGLIVSSVSAYADDQDRNKSIGSGAKHLVDMLISDAGVASALGKSGIRGQAATHVKRSVKNSLVALYGGNGVPSKRQLARALQGLPSKGKDGRIVRELKVLLNKKEADLTKGDFVDAVNNLIYLANRYGLKSTSVLACAQCVSDSLAKSGFKFTMELVENKQSQKVLTSVLPQNPRDLRNYISKEMKGFGGSGKDFDKLVGAEEERALALFLGLNKYGSKSQKAFIEAVKEVSGGKLVDSKNPHKLWKLFADDASSAELEGWTKLLKEVNAEAKASKISKKDAFYKVLTKKAGDDANMTSRIDTLKAKRCFFQ